MTVKHDKTFVYASSSRRLQTSDGRRPWVSKSLKEIELVACRSRCQTAKSGCPRLHVIVARHDRRAKGAPC